MRDHRAALDGSTCRGSGSGGTGGSGSCGGVLIVSYWWC